MINILQHGNLIGQPEKFSVFFSSSFCRLFKLPTWKMMITLFIFFCIYVCIFFLYKEFLWLRLKEQKICCRNSHIFSAYAIFLAEYMRRIRDSPNSALCDDFLAYEWNLYMLCSMDVVENCFPTYSNFSGNFINYASSTFIK